MRHQAILYAMGVVGALLCCPALFVTRNNDSNADSQESINAISSPRYAYSVVATLGYAIPLALEVISNTFEKSLKFSKTYNPLLVRAMICFTLLVTSMMNVYYSIWYPNAMATWIILNIRVVLFVPIVIRQLMKRYAHALSVVVWYFIAVTWIVLSIVKCYHVDTASLSPRGIIFLCFQIAAFTALVYSQLKHLSMVWTKNYKLTDMSMPEFVSEIGVPLIILCSVTLWILLTVQMRSTDVYSRTLSFWAGFNYVSSSGLMFCSVIFNHEFCVNYLVAEGKLSMKRLFVRYVSHEVRTPLNSCVLGLKYMHSMLDELESRRSSHCQSPREESSSIDVSQEVKKSKTSISDLRGVVSEIEDCCATALDFMNNLLLYEKIDSMELPLYFKTENLRDICRSVVRSFNLSAMQTNIRLLFAVNSHHANKLNADEERSNSFNSAKKKKDELLAFVDAPKIMVILRNLVSNALKFTPNGGQVTVAITPVDLSSSSTKVNNGCKYEGFRRRSSVDGNHLFSSAIPVASPHSTATHYRISVCDTGPGLNTDEQKHLFGSFVQFSPNDRQQGGGSGIGLYLSQKIAEGHGTQLNVISEGVEGKGTMFFFDVPKSNPMRQSLSTQLSNPTDDEDHANISTSIAIKSSPSVRSLRFVSEPKSELSILVVDDSQMNRKMLKRVLRQHSIGKTVDEASDGIEMLSLIGVPVDHKNSFDRSTKTTKDSMVLPSVGPLKHYDIILVDSSMPRMSGVEAVFRLRQCGYKGLIIGVTGNALQEELVGFCDKGADYALPKPFEVEKLMEILDSVYDSAV